MSFLTNPQDAEFWVAVALVLFVVILWRVKVPSLATKALDDAGAKVQAQLDEAKRLREEAETILQQARAQKADTEAAVESLMRSAREDAERMRAEAAAKLVEDVKRRGDLAERKIALAETQAANEVKGAAADMAAQAAEAVLAARLAKSGGRDASLEAALQRVGSRLSPAR